MTLSRLKPFAPYLLVLGGAAYFYSLANRFTYDAQPGRLGPDGWPKLLLICLMAVCVFEIARRALVMAGALSEARKALDVTEEAGAEDLPDEPAHPAAVLAAVVLTGLYLLLFDTVGFFLSTFLYTCTLMWIGKFRHVVWNPVVGFAFTFAFMFAFMRIIFVDLPIGVEPFSQVSTTLMRLMGVR